MLTAQANPRRRILFVAVIMTASCVWESSNMTASSQKLYFILFKGTTGRIPAVLLNILDKMFHFV